MQIDYRMSISNRYGKRFYMLYFRDMACELTKGMKEGSPQQREVLERVRKMRDAYSRIKQRIINYSFEMQPYFYNCGCRKCLKEFPSN